MKIRWFSMCDENGVWTTPVLQVWDSENNRWEDIPYVDCKTWEEESYLHNEFAY